jgi:DNA topoisomerase-1
MHLVIVESPTKAKTIRKFLGKDYTVLASMGHIRDLPASSADVPEALKKTPQGKLGVDPETFEPLYVISQNKKKTVTELKAALKDAEDVYLATDEDREGESISWHLLEVLKPKVPVKRMVFHEITKPAIEKALANPRELDERLVRAQETRRILDRLVGYTVSPVLWKRIAYGLSAGRVQSVVLKVIVDRERARMRFKKATYWDALATLESDKTKFEAKLIRTKDGLVATGKHFDEETGELSKGAGVVVLDEAKANAIAEACRKGTWIVREVQEKQTSRKAPAPFTTSTLQQEGNRKLGFSSKETMSIAQKLYEQGHITYMRTDSTVLSAEAVQSIRARIQDRFGGEFVPATVRSHASTAKGAQEAHEAIRPSLSFTPPSELDVTGSERELYELIWMRAMASQMPDATLMQSQITIDAAEGTVFQANGMRIVAPGFLRAYVEGKEDTEEALTDQERPLPALKEGMTPNCVSLEPKIHETKPPGRYSEAGLVQFMEKEGIGRPSTYAATISTLIDRTYIKKAGGSLAPTFTGFAVVQYLERSFPDLVQIAFTSKMEDELDQIATGHADWLAYLKKFYQGETGLAHKVEEETTRKDDTTNARHIEILTAPNMQFFIGRFGPYLEGLHPEHGTPVKASLDADFLPGDVTPASLAELLAHAQQGPTTLGTDEATGKQIYLRTGSYGPYLQLGEDPEDPKSKDKPKRVSIPKTVVIETLNREQALGLLSLPRLLGTHPTSGKDVRAGLGRFGPYIVHDGDFRSLQAEDNVLTVTFERALAMLAEPKKGRGGRTARSGRNLGPYPDGKGDVTVHDGRYGAYIKYGTVNATIPKTMAADQITMEQAVELLKAKAENAPAKKGRGRKSTKTEPTEVAE